MAQGRSSKIISMMNWIRTSRLSTQKYLSFGWWQGSNTAIDATAGGTPDAEFGEDSQAVQGYLAYDKPPPRRTLQ
jgi:hypothetical protein